MPVLNPSTTGPLISDYAEEVLTKLENRQSDVTRAYEWLANTLVELSGNTELRDDFDELEAWSDTYTLTAGTQEYAYSNFLNPELIYNQATLSVLMWIDPPTNSKRVKLHPSHYQDSDRMTINASGPWSQPSDWYRFGDMIGFNPIPNLNYQVQMRALQLFPINEEDIGSTPILLTRQWKEVIIQSAVMRGFMELQQFDKALAVKALLYGDPKHPSDKGMIGAVHTRRKKESYRESIGLRPIVRAYGYGGGVR